MLPLPNPSLSADVCEYRRPPGCSPPVFRVVSTELVWEFVNLALVYMVVNNTNPRHTIPTYYTLDTLSRHHAAHTIVPRRAPCLDIITMPTFHLTRRWSPVALPTLETVRRCDVDLASICVQPTPRHIHVTFRGRPTGCDTSVPSGGWTFA